VTLSRSNSRGRYHHILPKNIIKNKKPTFAICAKVGFQKDETAYMYCYTTSALDKTLPDCEAYACGLSRDCMKLR